uniref:Protein transport protein sec16 n=1 Tax=Steinernema glaseri TaxID=37863 RepID=A0A1I7ZK20_9BILA
MPLLIFLRRNEMRLKSTAIALFDAILCVATLFDLRLVSIDFVSCLAKPEDYRLVVMCTFTVKSTELKSSENKEVIQMDRQAGSGRPPAEYGQLNSGIQYVHNEYANEDRDDGFEAVATESEFSNDLKRQEAIFGENNGTDSERSSEEEDDGEVFTRRSKPRLQTVTRSNNSANGVVINSQKLREHSRREPNLLLMKKEAENALDAKNYQLPHAHENDDLPEILESDEARSTAASALVDEAALELSNLNLPAGPSAVVPQEEPPNLSPGSSNILQQEQPNLESGSINVHPQQESHNLASARNNVLPQQEPSNIPSAHMVAPQQHIDSVEIINEVDDSKPDSTSEPKKAEEDEENDGFGGEFDLDTMPDELFGNEDMDDDDDDVRSRLLAAQEQPRQPTGQANQWAFAQEGYQPPSMDDLMRAPLNSALNTNRLGPRVNREVTERRIEVEVQREEPDSTNQEMPKEMNANQNNGDIDPVNDANPPDEQHAEEEEDDENEDEEEEEIRNEDDQEEDQEEIEVEEDEEDDDNSNDDRAAGLQVAAERPHVLNRSSDTTKIPTVEAVSLMRTGNVGLWDDANAQLEPSAAIAALFIDVPGPSNPELLPTSSKKSDVIQSVVEDAEFVHTTERQQITTKTIFEAPRLYVTKTLKVPQPLKPAPEIPTRSKPRKGERRTAAKNTETRKSNQKAIESDHDESPGIDAEAEQIQPEQCGLNDDELETVESRVAELVVTKQEQNDVYAYKVTCQTSCASLSIAATPSVIVEKNQPVVDVLVAIAEPMEPPRSSSGSTAYEDAREYFENDIPIGQNQTVKQPSPETVTMLYEELHMSKQPSPENFIYPLPGFEATDDEEDDIVPRGDIIPLPVVEEVPAVVVKRGRRAKKKRGRPPGKKNNVAKEAELPQADALVVDEIDEENLVRVAHMEEEVQEAEPSQAQALNEPNEAEEVVIVEDNEEEEEVPKVVSHRPRSRTRRRRSGVDMLISQCRDTKILSEAEIEALKENIPPTAARPRPRRSNSSNASRDNSHGRPASLYRTPKSRETTKRLDTAIELDIMIAARECKRKPKDFFPPEPQNDDDDDDLEEIPPFNEDGYEEHEYDYDPALRYEVAEQFFDSYYDYMMQHNFENVWECDVSKNTPRKSRSVSRARSRTPAARSRTRGKRSARSSMAPYSDIEDSELRLTHRHKNTDFELFKYLRSDQFKKDRHNRNERIRRLRLKTGKQKGEADPEFQRKKREREETIKKQLEEGDIYALVQNRAQRELDGINAEAKKTTAKSRGRSSSAAAPRRSNSTASTRQRKPRTPRQAASAAATPRRRRSIAPTEDFDPERFNDELDGVLEDGFISRETTPVPATEFSTVEFANNELYSPAKPNSGYIPYTGPPVPSGRRSQYKSPSSRGTSRVSSRAPSRTNARRRSSQSASRPASRAPSRPRPPPPPSVPDELYTGPRTRSRSRPAEPHVVGRSGVTFTGPEPAPKKLQTKAQRAQTPGPLRAKQFGKEPKAPTQRGRKRLHDANAEDGCEDSADPAAHQVKRHRRRSTTTETRRTPAKRGRKRQASSTDDDEDNQNDAPGAVAVLDAKRQRADEDSEFIDVEGDHGPPDGGVFFLGNLGHDAQEDVELSDPDQPSTSRAVFGRRRRVKSSSKFTKQKKHMRYRSHSHSNSPPRFRSKNFKTGDSILKGSTNVFHNSLVTLYCVKCHRRPPHVRVENENPEDEYFECCFCKTRIFLYRANNEPTVEEKPTETKPDKYTEETVQFKQLGTGKERDQSEATPSQGAAIPAALENEQLEDEQLDPKPSTSSGTKTSTDQKNDILTGIPGTRQSSTSDTQPQSNSSPNGEKNKDEGAEGAAQQEKPRRRVRRFPKD